jgi:hypothetical protein
MKKWILAALTFLFFGAATLQGCYWWHGPHHDGGGSHDDGRSRGPHHDGHR